MALKHSDEFLDDLLAVLSFKNGITSSWAYKLLGRGSPPTVRIGLRVLVETGKARFEGDGIDRKYFRADASKFPTIPKATT